VDAVKGRWSRLSWLAGITLLAGGAILTPDYSHSSHTEQRQSHPKTQSTYSATPESFWERTTTDPIAAYTLALVVFTSVLAVVAIRQISFLKRADDTARMAANAAQEAADATRATVLKMDEIAQRQLRAYVGVKGAIPVLPGAGEWPQINLLITNFGQTPAYDVDFTIQWAIGACPHVEAQEFPQGIPAAFGPGEGSVLDPGEEKQLNAGRDVAMLDQRYPDTAPFTVEGAEAIRRCTGDRRSLRPWLCEVPRRIREQARSAVLPVLLRSQGHDRELLLETQHRRERERTGPRLAPPSAFAFRVVRRDSVQS